VKSVLIYSAKSMHTLSGYPELMSEVQKPQRIALMGISE
jgi:hypothetical protein